MVLERWYSIGVQADGRDGRAEIESEELLGNPSTLTGGTAEASSRHDCLSKGWLDFQISLNDCYF